jgi:hypothetical protein
MAADGTLYASDPKFSAQTGQIWRITRGADGKTVFVTQTDGRFIEAFRTDRPGREPSMQGPA